jgi:hypothetical protein
MEHLPNKFYIAGYAWLIIAMLSTKPFVPVIGLCMMTFCFIMSWINNYDINK